VGHGRITSVSRQPYSLARYCRSVINPIQSPSDPFFNGGSGLGRRGRVWKFDQNNIGKGDVVSNWSPVRVPAEVNSNGVLKYVFNDTDIANPVKKIARRRHQPIKTFFRPPDLRPNHNLHRSIPEFAEESRSL
jgi:hypothetical protein